MVTHKVSSQSLGCRLSKASVINIYIFTFEPCTLVLILPKSRAAMRPKATSASFCIIICSLVAMVTKCLTPPCWITVLTTS